MQAQRLDVLESLLFVNVWGAWRLVGRTPFALSPTIDPPDRHVELLGNLFRGKAAGQQVFDLGILLFLVGKPCPTFSFYIGIRSLPPLFRGRQIRRRKRRLFLPKLFVAARDLCFDRLHEVFHQVKTIRDLNRLRSAFTGSPLRNLSRDLCSRRRFLGACASNGWRSESNVQLRDR